VLLSSVAHGRRNRSGRPGGCPTNNLTNENFYVHIISTFVRVKLTKTRAEKCTHCDQLFLRKISKFDATRYKILRLKCIKFDFRWAPPQTLLGTLKRAPCDPLAVLKGPTFKAREQVEGRGKG